MDNTLLAFLRAALIILLLLLLSRLVQRYGTYNPSSISLTEELETILKPAGAPTADLVQARAIPNERLKKAFHLTNPRIVKIPHQIVMDKAYNACTAMFASPAPTHDFAACIQIITLYTILDLLEADIALLTARDLHAVASGINTLWSQSKVGTPDPAILDTINAHLARWLPNTPFNTPLDIIIPMWETLWRVVAVTLAYTHADPARVRAFAELFEDPDRDVFSREEQASGESPEAIVLEVLRLYPPTSNIARAEADGSIVKAPVRAVHRARSLWGERADVFDPARFADAAHPPIYAFGYGPLTCPANHWAPMAAAVIVSAILKAAEEQDLRIIAGSQIGGRAGWDDWAFGARST